jgi:hypothetical protein
VDYAVALSVEAPSQEVVDAFEDALDLLPEAAMVGNVEHGSAALLFVVQGPQVVAAAHRAAHALRGAGVRVPENARLRVEREGTNDAASISGTGVIRLAGVPE